MADTQTVPAAVVKHDGLPVDSLRDALPHLRRPFTPEAVKWKVQTVFKDAKGCIVVGYIDVRLVIERLNAVVGDAWNAEYTTVDGTKLMWCRLLVFDTERDDVGESPKGFSKDVVSDSLKRAAVHFGVGVSIYALPQIMLWMGDNEKRIERIQTNKGPTLRLTEHGHTKLREGYAKWLEAHGRRLFGEPLDHGEVEGDTIDADAAAGEFTPEAPAALDDDRARELIGRARELWADMPADVRPSPGRFAAWLTGAQHSHEELERLVAHLEGLNATEGPK